MSKPVENPTRLGRLPASEDSLGIGRMFRNARELPDEDLPTLRWQLRTSQRMRVVRPRLFLKLSLAIGVAFCVGGVVGATVWPFWPKKEPAKVTPAPTTSPEKTRKPHATSQATVSAPVVAEPLPVVEEPKAAPAPAKHRARVAVLNQPPPLLPPPLPAAPPAAAPPPAAPSPIAVEQALLGQAVKALRDGHDARTALALLAQHAQQFPHGALALEESMLRVEALLALGRQDEALSVLDRTQLASLPNREEQLVVRGELRASNQRWREAKQDFDDALGAGRALPAASAKARTIQERALWGRASARSRLGDEAGARADLELYLKRFPGGRFAASATASLKGNP
jgi:TolA-binding protein